MISIAANVDEPEKFDVSTYLDNSLIETQTVAQATELTESNYIDWYAVANLKETAVVVTDAITPVNAMGKLYMTVTIT